MNNPTKKAGFKPGHDLNLMRERIDKPDTLCYRVRKQLNISQAEMGVLLEVHEGSVGRYESRIYQPNKWVAETLIRLARRHGVK